MRKILIVDDEHAIRRTLCLLLEAEGYEVLTAATADAARAHEDLQGRRTTGKVLLVP